MNIFLRAVVREGGLPSTSGWDSGKADGEGADAMGGDADYFRFGESDRVKFGQQSFD